MAIPSLFGPPVIATEIPTSVEIQPIVLPAGTMGICVLSAATGETENEGVVGSPVLSYSVTMCINAVVSTALCISANVLGHSTVATAIFINQCDRLFDSLSGCSYSVKGKMLCDPVNSNSPHMVFCQEGLQFVKS